MQNAKKQLVALDAGSYALFFNSSGFYLSLGSYHWCGWMDYADFDLFYNAYDSRFLDYLGTWTIIAKRGFTEVPNAKLTAWAGTTMDPSAVFPSISYLWETGIYAGLDEIEPTAMIDGGESYFYPTLTTGRPNFSLFEAGTIESLQCPGTE